MSSLRNYRLFNDAAVLDFKADRYTNQLTRLVVALSRGPYGDGQLKFTNTASVIQRLPVLWSTAKLPGPSDFAGESCDFDLVYCELLHSALRKYGEMEGIYFRKIPVQAFREAVCSSEFKSDNEGASHGDNEYSDIERLADAYDILSEVAKPIFNYKTGLTQKVVNEEIKKQINLDIPCLGVGRLFAGSGFAGVALMTVDPSVIGMAQASFATLKQYAMHEDKQEEPVLPLHLETLLISTNETGLWSEANHRCEQEHPLLEIAGNMNALDFVPKKNAIERYFRVNTRHLSHAMLVNMALKDTPPPLIGATIQEIHKKENHLDDWQMDLYPFRILISIGGKNLYLYAKEVDFALGLGDGSMATIKQVIPPEEKEVDRFFVYDEVRKFTPIIHGNEFDLSERERQHLSLEKSRRVVIIGGAGGAATAYRIAVLGTDESGYRFFNADREKVIPTEKILENQEVKIFSRGKVNYNVLALQATESFEHAKKSNALYENHLLVSIQWDEHNKCFMLKFEDRIQQKEVVFFADQIISAVGQDASRLRNIVFSEFTQAELEEIRGQDGHFVALGACDGSVRFHGAMAANMKINDRAYTNMLAVSLEKSHLVRNGNDHNIMPCVIEKTCSFVASRYSNRKQISFNVNRCFLLHYDNADSQLSAFEIFLKEAGLCEDERSIFIEFLKHVRKNDNTGAGLSKAALSDYIKSENLDDRLEIVSSCTLVSRQEKGSVKSPSLRHGSMSDILKPYSVFRASFQKADNDDNLSNILRF